MTDSLIQAAVADTLHDIDAWADQLWEGLQPRTDALDARLVKLMTVGVMAGASTAEMDEMVGEPGTQRHEWFRTNEALAVAHLELIDRNHEHSDAVFREMVTAIAKKKPSMGVLSPKELSERLRQTAFFVSGVTKSNVLDEIRKKLLVARIKGHPQSWFTVEVQKIADLSIGQLENVFRTNVESAAGAGRWKQVNDPDVADLFFGYRYWNPRDERSRPLHRAMHGFVALKEDPIWRTIWTPNGYQCRCKVRPLRRHQAIDAGLIDERGRTLANRVFSTDLQRDVVQSIESGTAIVVGRTRVRFPDEGFRGNALMDLV